MNKRVIKVVAYAVVDNRRLLMVRKRNTGKFMFPGGKFKPGESDLDCLVREVQEELGCQVEIDTVRFLGEFTTQAANEPDAQLIARVYQGQLLGDPAPSNEIEEIVWFSSEGQAKWAIAPLIAECVLPRLVELSWL